MVKPLQYMLIYIYIYIYIYISCYFVLTNTVFLNTTSGPRKLPEYFIFASHGKFKTTITSSFTSCDATKPSTIPDGLQVLLRLLWP